MKPLGDDRRMGPLVKHRISRWMIAVWIVLAVVAVIFLTISYWPRSTAQRSGDPGGLIMARLTPIVRAVPGFETGRIPWIPPPGASGQFPVRYAVKIEPPWDSCDGMAGTFGWDPVTIQVGFRWTGSDQSLMNQLNQNLTARGWAVGPAPTWSQSPTPVWTYPTNQPTMVVSVDPPLENHQRIVEIQARPRGRLVGGC